MSETLIDIKGVRHAYQTATGPLAGYTVSVKEWNDQIIFLRRLVPGITSKSYGIQVGKLGLDLAADHRLHGPQDLLGPRVVRLLEHDNFGFVCEPKIDGLAISLIFGILVSISVVLLLMAALFESIGQPLAILITLPLALFGAFWTLWLAGFVFETLAFDDAVFIDFGGEDDEVNHCGGDFAAGIDDN